MSEFIIATDSAADLPQELVEEMGVTVLPLRFTIDGETREDHPDRRAMPIKAFYDLLREGKMGSTSAVNVGDYRDALGPVLKSGSDVLILAFSSGLSATCQSATIAAGELAEEFPQRKIYVVDTLCASMGEGLMVWKAVQMKKQGKSLEEIRDWVESVKLCLAHWVAVDDLAHLKRGGRISATTAFVGGMLSIKPIIHVDDEGKLVNADKTRGRAASLKYLVEKVRAEIDPAQGGDVFISHSDCYDEAKGIGDALLECGAATQVTYSFIGPVIGSHTGPGTIAIFFFGSRR